MGKILTEAGKILAARNKTRLQAAMEALQAILGEITEEEDCEPGKKPMTEAARSLIEAVLRQSDSMDGIRELLRTAIREKLVADPTTVVSDIWVYIVDLFPQNAIYERDGALYQVSYTILETNGEQSVILGNPAVVERAYIPKTAVQESAGDDLEVGFIPLVEKAVRADGTVPIKLIDPGWGSSGYYSKEVLERDGPKVFPAGLKMYADHPTPQEEAARPERSIKDLAAVLTTPARWEDAGQDGPGLYAEAKVYDGWRGHIDDMASDIGVSIRALGKSRMGEAEGRKGPIVEAIAGAKSVDFVTDAGRGGKILSLREAATQRFTGGNAPKAGSNSSKEENTMALSEAEQKKLLEDNQKLSESVNTMAQQLARLSEAHLVNAARDHARRTLAGINLPQVTRERLVESLAMSAPSKDGVLDVQSFTSAIQEAAKAEAGYLASLTGSGKIHGMGETFQESADDLKPEALQESLAEAFRAIGLDEKKAAAAAHGR